MKRLIKLVIVLCLFIVTFTLSACNDGSIDELYGIYGLSSLYYKDANGTINNYADKFDYIIMVVKEDNTIDLYSRVNGEDEIEYHFTYTVKFSEDEDDIDKNIVDKITLNQFIKLSAYKNKDKVEENGYTFILEDDFIFNFGSLNNRLKHVNLGLDKNKDGENKFTSYRNNYDKLYDKISDKLIEKAKNKQIKDRDERLSEVDSED